MEDFIKGFAILGFIVSSLGCLVIMSQDVFSAIYVFAGTLLSFVLLYGFAEIISLLRSIDTSLKKKSQAIKQDNTLKDKDVKSNENTDNEVVSTRKKPLDSFHETFDDKEHLFNTKTVVSSSSNGDLELGEEYEVVSESKNTITIINKMGNEAVYSKQFFNPKR